MRIYGLEQCGLRVGASSPVTAIKYATLAFDPMPLSMLEGMIWGWGPYLDEWKARREELASIRRSIERRLPALPVVIGRERIAKRIGVGERITERWSRLDDDPLPVIGTDDPRERIEQRVWLYEGALRDWTHRHTRPYKRVAEDRVARG